MPQEQDVPTSFDKVQNGIFYIWPPTALDEG